MAKKTSKTSGTAARQGVEIDDGGARVWSSMEFSIHFADYEGVKIAFGQSQSCENDGDAIETLLKRQLRETEKLMAAKVTRLRRIWRDL